MDNIYAYTGKMLRINLSNGKISTESTLDYVKDWLGSSGIAIKILYDELRPWVTPYEPANKLIFSSGALLGTFAPGACKMNVSTLGPLTGGWASGASDSYVGGELKSAGYDVVIVEGKASLPVYIWIKDGKVELREASYLWGKTTWETLDLIRRELQDDSLHIVSIGPAGEKLVRGACIVQDQSRAFGRCGYGAVMGSKNLKALVAKGSRPVKVADPARFIKIVKKCRDMIINGGPHLEIFRKYGTLSSFDGKQDCCGIPYKNFQGCKIPDEVAEKVRPTKIVDKYEVSKQNFPGCVAGCSRHVYITDGPYAGLKTEINQWEVFGTLQARLAIEEPTFMVKANTYCNQLGIDLNAAGGAIGWAMECYQRGIIDEKDTDGLKLNWGDAGVALEFIRKICYREGFGDILAEGCARASDLVGRDSGYYAINIKGQDLYESGRGSNGWCLGAVTSTRGGGHTTGAPLCETTGGFDAEKAKELYGIDNANKATEYDGKARMVYYNEVLHRVDNSLGICHRNTNWEDLHYMGLPEIAELYSAATGIEITVADLENIAMRQLNMEKAFNLRHTNFNRKDDMPTPRELKEPIDSGKLAGWKIDEAKFNKMLDEYYELHGWDKETSFPTRHTLEKLGLKYVADDLEKIGKLR
jgi:aldehyde:ferredoxin oxidoreductase